MSPDELNTEVGKARLDACVFRIPHRGAMVPMCQMNAGGGRDELYAELQQRKGELMTASANRRPSGTIATLAPDGAAGE
jgi:hypothetical protein